MCVVLILISLKEMLLLFYFTNFKIGGKINKDYLNLWSKINLLDCYYTQMIFSMKKKSKK